MKYEFSVPMPFTKNGIDKLITINRNAKKSEIKCLYFSLPYNSPDYTGFEMGRFYDPENYKFENWKPIIEYSINKGFYFIYLLNSPKMYNNQLNSLEKQLERLDILLNNLIQLDCNSVRVCNPQLIEYLNVNYKNFKIYLSTSNDYQNIETYTNIFKMYNNIVEFVPSYNLNKNFKFLKNIKNKFPNIKIELMLNEGCLSNCPLRIWHNVATTEMEQNYNDIFSRNLFLNKCKQQVMYNKSLYISSCNVIYPWELAEYKKLGITKFKLVGRNSFDFKIGRYIDYYNYYLLGIENLKNINNIPIRFFNNYICNNSIFNATTKEIKYYLPKIQFFKKYGHLCASRCGVECRYCYKCAEKIEKVFLKKKEEERKRTIPVCVI